ncbi:glycosyltransferase family 2 protein [Botryobacter ruber]|uniref:glycosyltransferase family 2 protein n=1 Tax=Botryobacter ruber TaxID=2171629 RepID=UPI000E0A4FF9|nr:glycosyltransferase [Botryobacter ruber]
MQNMIIEQPLITVIVPCYNYGHLVTETLQNLKEQSYQVWECVIVNDGSTDNTIAIVSEFIKGDSRFRLISQPNKGLSVARNSGIKIARGEYIQLLDADDLLEKHKFKVQATYLANHPEVDLVYGNVKYFYSNEPAIYYKNVSGEQLEWMPRVSGQGDDILVPLLKNNIMPVNSPLIRKRAFEIAGTFDETLLLIEDWDMWLRFAMRGIRFQYLELKQTDALVRMHSVSISQDKWKMRINELELKERLHQGEMSQLHKQVLAKEKQKVCFLLFRIILKNAASGQISTALHRQSQLLRKCFIMDILKYGSRKALAKIGLTFNDQT